MDKFNWKSAGLLVAAALLGWAVTQLTGIIGAGVEGSISSNPAITDLESKHKALEEEYDAHVLASSSRMTAVATELEAISKAQRSMSQETSTRIDNIVLFLRGEE